MGAPKLKWTSEEECALRAGVVKYGTGKWRTILKDPEFAACLVARSNVDLKDKWRNLMSSVSPGGQGSKTPRPKPLAPVPLSSAAPLSTATTSSAAAAISDHVISSPKSISTSTTARNPSPRCDYDDMILEALTALGDPNGTEVATIASFMEERHQLPPSFRRALSSKLKRLVLQEKISRVRNGYKLRDLAEVNPAVPGPLLPIDGSMQLCSNGTDASSVNMINEASVDMINEASMAAAMKIAEADAMSALAEEAAREAEIDLRLVAEADAFLEAASSIFGEVESSLFDEFSLDEVEGFDYN